LELYSASMKDTDSQIMTRLRFRHSDRRLPLSAQLAK
jgi:hypothetical protein